MDVNAIPPEQPPQQIRLQLPAFLRNLAVIQAIAQIVFVIIFVSSLALLWSNISTTLAERNLVPSFEFLNNRAGFDISEAPDWYTPNNTYGEAFLVGVINTLRVVSVGLVLATIIGVLLGVFLLSPNWLIRTISRVYVEILRNTPLLVQLIFWYFVVMFGLPAEDITLPSESVFVLSLRVVIYPPLLLLAWLAVRRGLAPRRTAEGVLVGALLVEIVYGLIGSGTAVVMVVGVAGAVLVALAQTDRFSTSMRGQALGVGTAAVGQAVVSVIIALLVSAGTLDASAVWWEVFPAMYISRRAFVFPELAATDSFLLWLAVVIVGALVGYAVYRTLVSYAERTGKLIPSGIYGFLVLVVIAGIGWAIISARPAPEEIVIDGETLSIVEAREQGLIGFREEAGISTAPLVGSMPVRGRFRFEIGTLISPEYMALLLGLVIYTSAFIGEIVRAGIQAVPYGQIEAARATGLTNAQTLRLVVLPQALRLIIPPLSNQYLNLSKNSSLATAVAFADTYQIGQTMMNQSGQSVTGFTMILVTYLVMSLVISAFMNLVNSRFQLKTR